MNGLPSNLETWVCFPARVVTSLHSVETDTMAHTISYPADTEDYSPRRKAAEA
jgi:hypothetical protein